MKTRRLGPYTRRHRFGNLDGRTYAGRLYNEFRSALIKDVTDRGAATPNMTKLALIEATAFIRVRLALMSLKIADGGFTQLDSDMFLSWVGHLRRNLVALGLDEDAVEPPPYTGPTLADLRREAAERGAAA